MDLDWVLQVPSAHMIIASCVFHLALFFGFPTKDPTPYAFKSRVCSTFHAIVCIVVVVYWNSIFTSGFLEDSAERTIGKGVAGTGDEWQRVLMAFSLGYFASDTFILFAFYKECYDHGSAIHHFLVVTTVGTGVWTGVSVPAQFHLLFDELSTPFLNFKFFFRNNHAMHQLVTALFILAFLFCRNVAGMWLTYKVTTIYAAVDDIPALFPGEWDYLCYLWQYTCLLASRVLNLYWTVFIFKKIGQSLGLIESKKAKKKDK